MQNNKATSKKDKTLYRQNVFFNTMKKNLYIFGFLTLIVSCTGLPDFSNTPSISYNNVRIITTQVPGQLGIAKKDSVIISINYQDGDGDIGHTEEELKNVFKTQGDGFQNYMVDFYFKKNGKFEKIVPDDIIGGNIKFHLKEGTKPGPIEGVIDYSIDFYYNLYSGFKITGKQDTIKLGITIKDRALNVSNTTETPEFVIFK